MKKTFKKTASVILAAAIGALSFSAAVPAFAADEEVLSLYVEYGDTSEFGVQPYRYVDENGREISFETLETASFGGASLPSSYDSREEGIITEVKNQGSAGNCWAYSSISAAETSALKKGYAQNADYSEAHLTWFTGRGLAEDKNDLSYGDGYNIEKPYLYGGNWKRAAATLARWSGVAQESEFPTKGIYDMGNYAESSRYNTSAGVILESAQALTDADDVKQWILENGSASVAFYQATKYLNSKTGAYCCLENYSINHMVTIIGWDDNYAVENFGAVKPSRNGAWLCKNSWGKNWGNDGYFWLSYEDATSCQFAGFTVEQKGDYYKNYTYNGTEWNSASGTYGTVQVANVFTASGNEKLTAVAFHTVGTNVETKIFVYKNIPETNTSPVEGTLAAKLETVIEREGYHTVYLDEAVNLEAGEKFSVVAQYKNLDGNPTFFPVESKTVEYQSYSSREGESYLNYGTNAKNWKTAASRGYNNVYVQAFTECEHQTATKTEGITCTQDGVKSEYCTQCGKVESETSVSHSGHSFGTWSQFRKTSDGEEISTRECVDCGETETRKLSSMNVVKADKAFEMLFARFFEIIRSLFSFR